MAFTLHGRRHSKAQGAAVALRALACIAAIQALFHFSSAWLDSASQDVAAPLPRSFVPAGLEAPSPRRQLLLGTVAASGAALADMRPALALTDKEEEFAVRESPIAGIRSYKFTKPDNFRRYSSPVDPSGYIFRNTEDSYYSFAIRAEVHPNASTDFSPEGFVKEKEMLFLPETGSSFTLIRGGTPVPDRVDEFGTKYYEVEYVVRAQLGVTFDTLKTLHFLTIFAATPESVIVFNLQDKDENWEKHVDVLKKTAKTFAITGGPPPEKKDMGFFR